MRQPLAAPDAPSLVRGTQRLVAKMMLVVALAVGLALFAIAQGVNIFPAGGFAIVFGTLCASVLADSVRRPLEDLDDVARALVGGTLTRRPSLEPYDESGGLADSLRHLADQLSAQRQELAAAEELLVALTESLNEGVVAVDARQQVVRINETARRLLQLREPVPFHAEHLPRDRALREALTSVLAGGDALPDEVRVEDRTLSLTARPLPAGGAVLAVYDLTPFRRLEAVRRDFVANVSHELRTPLTVVSGFVETLADEELPSDLRRKFLGMVEANVRRMQRIVDDLLDLSRIESGGWRPNPIEQDIAAMASEISAPLLETARAKGVVLRVAVAPDASTVYADSTAARQILINLTENALRHTTSGEAVLFSEADDEGTWIGVRDTGVGIGVEHLPRIFERFYRADPGRAREVGGTGLGLAIVRHLTEAHGGRVRAESTPGVGTTISAFFPDASKKTV